MDIENALPTEATEAPQAGEQQESQAVAEVDHEAAAEQKAEEKPQKTPEQREIERLRRGLDRKTRQLYEARSRLELTPQQVERDNRSNASDSEPLSLTRAELAEMVKAEAARLAPTLREQATETERRQGVIQSLAKTWGQERFDEVASDLDDALGGLADRNGRPKPAVEAVFEADNPAAVIEYLADPDNHDEADKIARMSAAQAGKAIARLEDRLQAAKSKAAPKASKAPAPLDAVRGGPSSKSDYSQIASDADWYAARNKARKGK